MTLALTNLSIAAANLIGRALEKVPYEESAALIGTLRQQVRAQKQRLRAKAPA
jgi:hypothetical protein